jgi:hypothetical protein
MLIVAFPKTDYLSEILNLENQRNKRQQELQIGIIRNISEEQKRSKRG